MMSIIDHIDSNRAGREWNCSGNLAQVIGYEVPGSISEDVRIVTRRPGGIREKGFLCFDDKSTVTGINHEPELIRRIRGQVFILHNIPAPMKE